MTRRAFGAPGVMAAINGLTDAERSEGWKLLFDGKSTEGWLEITGKPFPSNCRAIEDGCLRTIMRQDGMQDIRTCGDVRIVRLPV